MEKQQITYKGTPRWSSGTPLSHGSLSQGRSSGKLSAPRTPLRISAKFSAETLQARREWHNIFKVMKEKSTLPSKTLIQI